jgi:predicted DNA-binding protein
MENVTKKKLGRPPVIEGGSAVLAVRLPMEHQQFVVNAAKHKRLPIAEILREAVQDYVASNCNLGHALNTSSSAATI